MRSTWVRLREMMSSGHHRTSLSARVVRAERPFDHTLLGTAMVGDDAARVVRAERPFDHTLLGTAMVGDDATRVVRVERPV